jgi:hypothetical protein
MAGAGHIKAAANRQRRAAAERLGPKAHENSPPRGVAILTLSSGRPLDAIVSCAQGGIFSHFVAYPASQVSLG